MTITAWIAGSALLISLAALGLSVEARLRDRYKVKYESFMVCTHGDDEETFQITVNITNQ